MLQAGTQPLQPRQAAAAVLRNPDFLRALFTAREGRLLALLAGAVSAAGGQPSKEEAFDTWMKQESDLVQVGPPGCPCKWAVPLICRRHECSSMLLRGIS